MILPGSKKIKKFWETAQYMHAQEIFKNLSKELFQCVAVMVVCV